MGCNRATGQTQPGLVLNIHQMPASVIAHVDELICLHPIVGVSLAIFRHVSMGRIFRRKGVVSGWLAG